MKYILLIAAFVSLVSCSTTKTLKFNNPELITDKLKFTEGPIWTGDLYIFSDIPSSKQYQYDPKSKKLSVYIENSHYSNGLFIKDSVIYSANHDRTLRMNKMGKKTKILQSKFQGKKLNSPNDLYVIDEGIFFTDPIYGIKYKGSGPAQAEEEQAYRGVYFRSTKGELKQIISNLTLPNGIIYKDHTLYVTDSSDGTINEYKLNKSFDILSHRVIAIIKNDKKAMADGIGLGPDNNLYAAGPGAVYVYNLNGKLLKTIPIDSRHISNVAFGGESGKDLMVTAANKVFLFKAIL